MRWSGSVRRTYPPWPWWTAPWSCGDWPARATGPSSASSSLTRGLLPALEQFRKLAQERRLSLAAYVSLPRVTEVANAIRRCLCPNQLAHCRESCSNRRSDRVPLQQPPSVPGPGPVRGTAGAGPTLSPLPHQLLGALGNTTGSGSKYISTT